MSLAVPAGQTETETETAFCVFAKVPRPGRVKTRLARTLGDELAARIAGAFLDDTWQRATSLARIHGRAVLALDGNGTADGTPDGTDDAKYCNSAKPGDEVWEQGGGDLGARMERVLRRALGESRVAVALGTDSPGLPSELLEQAQSALGRADAVIGPSSDGGFYLLALKHCPEGLLGEIPWSAEDTCARTIDRLLDAGMSVAVIDSWFDVDEVADLNTLKRLLDADLIEAPRTRELLSCVSPDRAKYGESRCATQALRVSVVIPTLNESARIDARLRELSTMAGVAEVFIVDGGSDDDTVERARRWQGASAIGQSVRVIRAERGRGKQMNAGTRYATGDVLLFLHADVELPESAMDRIADIMSTSAVAGFFKTHTVDDSPQQRSAPWLRLADARSRYTGLPYGDQAIFVRSKVFREIGGYPSQPLMEDLEFSRRLRRNGKIRRARASVRVSGRRFIERPIFYTFLVNVFPLLYALGVSPRTLAKLYRDSR